MTDRTLQSDSPVQYLRGVGPRRADIFARLGITTASQLLNYFPRTHEFRPPLVAINDMLQNHTVTVAGIVDTMQFKPRSNPPRLEIVLEDHSGKCLLIWFNAAFMKGQIFPGDQIAAWGKIVRYKSILQIVNPKWTKINGPEDLIEQEGKGLAVYPATAELPSHIINRVINTALDQLLTLVTERYPQSWREQRKLPSRNEAYHWIHNPENQDQVIQARRALAYDELFLMELGIGLRREHSLTSQYAYPMAISEKIDQRIRRLFPFDFTPDQNKVVDEICQDMNRNRPMNRLLQGDVGSGKTAVALYAALLTVAHRKQVAIMAPTEILAEQHYLNIERYLNHSRVRRVLLKGGITGPQRRLMLSEIADGTINIVIGTQALLQSDVVFKELGLVVVDEQHKFGVRQRETIRAKDIAPHYLVMTATPIPRTLAMTVFGDLEVSIIENLPPGRKPIDTRWITPDLLPSAYEFIRDQIRQGRQAYFVYPRVDIQETEQDLLDENGFPSSPEDQTRLLKAAVAEHKRLQERIFSDFTVGLVHGQMSADEKNQVMDDFRNHKIDILVATVVIEVGVDVPNATVMVIEHADRFGLAQLHQLRGRIGRGRQQSCCLLFGSPLNEQAQRRLEIMTQTNDGFRIAEEDLRLRGPGQFFGTSQHGLPELKIANLIDDFDLLQMARRDAFALAKTDPQLSQPEHQELKKALRQAFGDNLVLVDVG